MAGRHQWAKWLRGELNACSGVAKMVRRDGRAMTLKGIVNGENRNVAPAFAVRIKEIIIGNQRSQG